MVKTDVTYKQGSYGDREIIELMNKVLSKKDVKTMTIYGFKTLGLKVQSELKTKDLSSNELNSLIKEVLDNPPKPPVVVPPPAPTKEEIALARKAQEDEENKTTSSFKNGKETIHFSKKGMDNMHQEDNSLFEMVGKSEITDHEDDGRIFKYQKVRRLSDGKNFAYSYIWHAEWGVDFFENNLHEI